MSDNIIYLEVNGIKYSGFVDVNVSSSIENFASQFDFSTTVKDGDRGIIQNDLKVQDAVRVFIDDNVIMTGFIEDLNISYSATSHSIGVAGRDKTGDLIDSSIIQQSYKQTDFVKMANLVLKDNGYDIKIINKIKNLPNLTVGATNSATSLDTGEKPTTENGETIAAYLSRYAEKIQALLLTDEFGNINIISEGSNIAKGSLINVRDNCNIKEGSISISTKDRFRFIECFSQSDNSTTTKQSVNQSAKTTDNEIRNPRRKIISIETGSLATSLQKMVNWDVNLRKAKGLRYNCTVQGYYSSAGQLWRPNTLVQIQDDICQLNGQYLIQGVTYKKSVDNGSTTELSIVQKGSFSPEPESEKSKKSKTSKIGQDVLNKLIGF